MGSQLCGKGCCSERLVFSNFFQRYYFYYYPYPSLPTPPPKNYPPSYPSISTAPSIPPSATQAST